MSTRTSKVWEYFKKINSTSAKCQVDMCCEIIGIRNSNTTGMINHLKLIHRINVLKSKSNINDDVNEESVSVVKRDTGILKFLRRESLGEILAKCAASDGFSFNAIAKSEAIQDYVKSRNFNMPKSPKTVAKHVLDFYEEKKIELTKKIGKLVENGTKFSITVDEWSDIRMRRYINVSLRSVEEVVNLGLIEITGSCNAEATVSYVKSRLAEFGLDVDRDIVASTHDGASVMIKYSQLLKIFGQTCLNHGIHLAVVDVFYKKSTENENVHDTGNEDEDEADDMEIDEAEFNNNDGENDSDDDVVTCHHQIGCITIDGVNVDPSQNEPMVLNESYREVLTATRKIIKFFKYSCVRSDLLQHNIQTHYGKNELMIILKYLKFL